MKICIDPGHYGSDYNPGVAAGYVESNFTWNYAHLLKTRLERYGVEVIFTRQTKDENPGLQERGRRSAGCDLFLSVHSNASDDPLRNAVFCHWSMVSGGEGVAKAIGYALTDFLGGEWGSIQPAECYYVESEKHPGQDYYGVLLGASKVGTPGVIVEHSFHTYAKYCEWAMQPINLDRMADVEVEAIAEYYGLAVITQSPYFIPLNVDLKKGDKGEEVKRMQMRFRQISDEYDEEVKNHSFVNGLPDGSFGAKMQKTVKNFQYDVGLPATGDLDGATRAVLNCTVVYYSNRVTELIEEKRELKEDYEEKLEATTDELVEANVRITEAVQILEGK